jgi:pimeloyl-ACP methyl ester carboxylesterase
MRHVLRVILILPLVLIALPPAWYALFPSEAPEMPPAGRRIEVDSGVTVNAIDRGSGPAVVLVHGLPGSAYDWTPLTDAIAARGRRAIAYDRIGYGFSDGRGDGDFTIDANARDLVGLLESEELRDATVVGWSYGGPVSLLAAGLAPQRVARLVLVGSGGPSEDQEEPPSIPFFFRPLMRYIGAVPPLSGAIMRETSVQAFSEGPQPDWWLPQLHANFAMPHTRETYREEGAGIGRSSDLGLDRLAQPVLLIHGDDDRLAPLAISQYFDRKLARSELLVIEGGSHMLPITHTELLADRIAAFSEVH